MNIFYLISVKQFNDQHDTTRHHRTLSTKLVPSGNMSVATWTNVPRSPRRLSLKMTFLAHSSSSVLLVDVGDDSIPGSLTIQCPVCCRWWWTAFLAHLPSSVLLVDVGDDGIPSSLTIQCPACWRWWWWHYRLTYHPVSCLLTFVMTAFLAHLPSSVLLVDVCDDGIPGSPSSVLLADVGDDGITGSLTIQCPACWRLWWWHSRLTYHPVSCLLTLVMMAFLAHLPSSVLLVDVGDDGMPGSLTIQCPACWHWWWWHSRLTYHPVSCLLTLVMMAFPAHLPSSVLLVDTGDDGIPGSLTIQCPVCWRWWWWHSWLTYHPVSCLLTLVMMAFPAHLPSSVLFVDVGDDGIPGSLTMQCPACWRWWWWHSRLTYHPVSCLLTLVMMAFPAHLPSSVLLVDIGDDGIPGSLTIQCPACWHWWWWHSRLTYHPVSCLLTLVMMAFLAHLPSSVLLVDIGDDGIPGSLTIQCPACWHWWWWHSRLTYHPVSCLLTLVMMAFPAHLPSSVLFVDVGDDGIPGSLTIQCPACWRWWWWHSRLTYHPVSCLLTLVMMAFLAHLPSSVLLVDVGDDGIPGSLTIQCPACWRWWWWHSWLTYHPVSCLLTLVMMAFPTHLPSSVLLVDTGDDGIPGSLTILCPACWHWWWWHSRLTYHPVSCLLTLVMMAFLAHLPSSVLLVDTGDDGIPGSLTIQCPACWHWWWWHSRLTYHPVSCLLTLVMMAFLAHLPSSVLLVDIGDDGIPGSLTIQCPACWHWWWWHSRLTYHPVSCLLTLVMMAFPANLPSSVLLVDVGDDGIPGSLTIQCPACWRWWWSHSWQTTTHHLGQPCSHTTLGHGSEIRLLFIDLTNSTQLKQIATQSKILTSNNAMPYNVVNFLQILTPHSSSMKANYRFFLWAQSLVYTLPVTVILYGIQGGAAITRSTFSNILTLDIP